MTGLIPEPNETPPDHPTVPIPVPPPAFRQLIPESRFGSQRTGRSRRTDPSRRREPPHGRDPSRGQDPSQRPPGWVSITLHPERLRQPARQPRRRPARRMPPPRPLRRPAVALPLTVLFGLLAAFFAWQAAEPFWLAVGHGEPGLATVTRCPAGESATYRCISFEAASGAFRVPEVTLLGEGDAARAEGVQVPAQMISGHHGRAYAASRGGLHLRWAIGLLLVLGCGAGIAWVTGATRLDEYRSRRRAVLLSLAGPLVLALGFLVAAL